MIMRDVCVQGVVNDMCEGRATIYIDLLGYDEVAHHSGPDGSTPWLCCVTSTARSAASSAPTEVDAAAVQDRGAVRPRPDPRSDVRATNVAPCVWPWSESAAILYGRGARLHSAFECAANLAVEVTQHGPPVDAFVPGVVRHLVVPERQVM